jgi:cytochrome c-type biogenesis protein CcmH
MAHEPTIPVIDDVPLHKRQEVIEEVPMVLGSQFPQGESRPHESPGRSRRGGGAQKCTSMDCHAFAVDSLSAPEVSDNESGEIMQKALAGWLVLAVAAWGAASSESQTRVEALAARLLAPCCYREPVSRHQSEIAVKMRVEIQQMVAAGESDEAILRGYKQRYGDRVIADFGETPGWAQWVPWALTLLAAAGLSWWLARMVRRTPCQRSSGILR